MLDKREIEEGRIPHLDFAKLEVIAGQHMGVIPVVLQDASTREVLFMAYMNQRALVETIRTHTVVLWSTSRNELWPKGATSGDILDVVEIRINCEQNSLLILVQPQRPGCCHTVNANDGQTRATCFYRRLNTDGGQLEFV